MTSLKIFDSHSTQRNIAVNEHKLSNNYQELVVECNGAILAWQGTRKTDREVGSRQGLVFY